MIKIFGEAYASGVASASSALTPASVAFATSSATGASTAAGASAVGTLRELTNFEADIVVRQVERIEHDAGKTRFVIALPD